MSEIVTATAVDADAELYGRRLTSYFDAFIKVEGSMKGYKLARETYRRAPSSYTKAALERAANDFIALFPEQRLKIGIEVAWDCNIRLNGQ